jgi:hypothetical protein
MRNKAILIIVLLVGVASYEDYTAATPQVISSESSIDKVSQAFSEIEFKEDKLTIYKLFAGSAEYLKNCKSLQATQQFDPILGRVQSSYSWNREKYPAFTDAVSEYLVSVGYNTPKPLTTDQQRKDFANIFQSLSEATKYE